MSREAREAFISEASKITIGAAVAIMLVVIGLVAWGVRLEGAVNEKVPRIQYVEDMSGIKNDLKSIKKALNIHD